LTSPETVHQRFMTKEIETWLTDSRVGNNRSFSSVDTATRNRSLRRPISTGFLIASQTDMPASALAALSLLDSVHSTTNSTHTHTHTHTRRHCATVERIRYNAYGSKSYRPSRIVSGESVDNRLYLIASGVLLCLRFTLFSCRFRAVD